MSKAREGTGKYSERHYRVWLAKRGRKIENGMDGDVARSWWAEFCGEIDGRRYLLSDLRGY